MKVFEKVCAADGSDSPDVEINIDTDDPREAMLVLEQERDIVVLDRKQRQRLHELLEEWPLE